MYTSFETWEVLLKSNWKIEDIAERESNFKLMSQKIFRKEY